MKEFNFKKYSKINVNDDLPATKQQAKKWPAGTKYDDVADELAKEKAGIGVLTPPIDKTTGAKQMLSANVIFLTPKKYVEIHKDLETYLQDFSVEYDADFANLCRPGGQVYQTYWDSHEGFGEKDFEAIVKHKDDYVKAATECENVIKRLKQNSDNLFKVEMMLSSMYYLLQKATNVEDDLLGKVKMTRVRMMQDRINVNLTVRALDDALAFIKDVESHKDDKNLQETTTLPFPASAIRKAVTRNYPAYLTDAAIRFIGAVDKDNRVSDQEEENFKNWATKILKPFGVIGEQIAGYLRLKLDGDTAKTAEAPELAEITQLETPPTKQKRKLK